MRNDALFESVQAAPKSAPAIRVGGFLGHVLDAAVVDDVADVLVAGDAP